MGWLAGEQGGLPKDILSSRASQGPGEQHLPPVAGCVWAERILPRREGSLTGGVAPIMISAFPGLTQGRE